MHLTGFAHGNIELHIVVCSLTVSIVTWFPDHQLLGRVIQSLVDAAVVAEQKLSEVALHVVDNSVNGSEVEALEQLLTSMDIRIQWQLHVSPRNLGFGVGHNQAINSITSDFHLVLNPDAILEPDAILKALEYMQTNPEAGLVVPMVADSSGEQTFLCRRYPSVLDLSLRAFAPGWVKKHFKDRLDVYEMRDTIGDTPVCPVPIASGCFMFFRTALLKSLGGFSPDYFMYFDDYDLCMRMSGKGKIAYVPAARIAHYGGDAARKGSRHIRMFTVSAVKFFSRWGWKWW